MPHPFVSFADFEKILDIMDNGTDNTDDIDSEDDFDYYYISDPYDDNENPEAGDGADEDEKPIEGIEGEPLGISGQTIEEEYHFEVSSNKLKPTVNLKQYQPCRFSILDPEHRGYCQSHGGDHQGSLHHHTDSRHHD